MPLWGTTCHGTRWHRWHHLMNCAVKAKDTLCRTSPLWTADRRRSAKRWPAPQSSSDRPDASTSGSRSIWTPLQVCQRRPCRRPGCLLIRHGMPCELWLAALDPQSRCATFTWQRAHHHWEALTAVGWLGAPPPIWRGTTSRPARRLDAPSMSSPIDYGDLALYILGAANFRRVARSPIHYYGADRRPSPHFFLFLLLYEVGGPLEPHHCGTSSSHQQACFPSRRQ
mmetsp:Transcript_15430/g.39859  ORF Transcript_15430/g.39859 Transcript_15430/m.39859 type:complete len:226 (+) Transcript_15430:887-1564(+)